MANMYGRPVPPLVEKSLATESREEAEIRAAPEILEHKKALLAYKVAHAMQRPGAHGFTRKFGHEMEPGSRVELDDGSIVIADKHGKLIKIDRDGERMEADNPKALRPLLRMENIPPTERRDYDRAAAALKKSVKDVDTEIVENWIAERKPAKTHVNSVRAMLALFKEMHPNKSFATADRSDAVEMVERLKERGNVSATAKTKIGTLVSAVNLEMSRKNPRVKFNPFAGVAKKDPNDTTRRLPLSEADVKLMEGNRHLFTKDELLMWTFCLYTGMRPAEVYALSEEFEEVLDHHPITGEPSHIRYIWIDRSKNLASTRAIPIPSAVQPLLPEGGIQGRMFSEALDNICGRINDKMRLVGITSICPITSGERKVFYSTRHRAKDRLQNAFCPPDIRKSLIGHSKGVHEGYGDEMGMPLWVKKDWIEYLNPLAIKAPTTGRIVA